MAKHFDLFAKVAAWERRLVTALAKAPSVEVVALVDEDGVRGSHAYDRAWTMDFSCKASRIGGAPIRQRQITIRRPVTWEEFRVFRREIRPESIVQLQARVVDKRSLGVPCGLLEHFHGVLSSDEEMNHCRQTLRGQIAFSDSAFGDFIYDDTLESYRTIVEWGDEPACLYLDAQKPASARRALEVAREIWQDQPAWRQRIVDRLLGELFPLKNDRWLADGEAPVSAAQFLQRVTLSKIHARPNGAIEFWHCDGDLFCDHEIVIRGSLRKGITEATLEG